MLTRILDTILRAVGIAEMSTGAVPVHCSVCGAVYDRERDHPCVETAFCLACNRRVTVEPDRELCAECGEPDLVLRKRGR